MWIPLLTTIEKYTDATKWSHCDKDDVTQVGRANESGNEEVSSHIEAFVIFQEGFRWLEV